MRTCWQLALVASTMAWLACCARAAPQGATPAPASAAEPAATMAASASPTSAADAGLAIAIARESAARAALDQTLHVQRRLQEDEREHRQAREAAQRGNGSERCIAGQKMRRVANGWVQAGQC
jgi:hypothetical protein